LTDTERMTHHAFDQAVRLTSISIGAYNGHTSAGYWNMVGPFGGATAATALNAVLQHPDLLGEPISLTVNYAGPIAAGAFTVTATPRRTNRSTQHWLVELLQTSATGEDEVMLTATAVTAARRTTWSHDEVGAPTVPRPQTLTSGMTLGALEWINRYDLRFAQGMVPTDWDGQGDASLSQVWVRDEPARALDFCSLAAMADVFFPRVYLRRALLVPAGTVSLTVYFHADGAQLQQSGTGYLLGQAQAQAFRNGFFDQSSQLWSESGVLLATSHQIVYFKE
jgi:acyl-CoA thioesterase